MSTDSQGWTAEESQEAIRKVMRKAAGDANFRRQAVSDPAAAILEVSGKELPEDYRLRFIDGAEADQTIVLPSSELTDAELENATGGTVTLEYLVLMTATDFSSARRQK